MLTSRDTVFDCRAGCEALVCCYDHKGILGHLDVTGDPRKKTKPLEILCRFQTCDFVCDNSSDIHFRISTFTIPTGLRALANHRAPNINGNHSGPGHNTKGICVGHLDLYRICHDHMITLRVFLQTSGNSKCILSYISLCIPSNWTHVYHTRNVF